MILFSTIEEAVEKVKYYNNNPNEYDKLLLKGKKALWNKNTAYHEWNKILPLIDHKLLNEIEGLENPTSENLIKWIWDKIKNDFSKLHKIKLSEDHGTGIIYNGE